MIKSSASPTWTICAVVDEPVDLLLEFCDLHIKSGASHIWLIFDSPSAQDLGPLEALDSVRLTLANDNFWQQVNGGDRPTAFDHRQEIMIAHQIRSTRTDWILVCDADELVYSKTGLTEFLARLPADVTHVNLPTREAVYPRGRVITRYFDTPYFKRPAHRRRMMRLLQKLGFSDPLVRAMGPAYAYSRKGFWGHEAGKTFYRKGVKILKANSHCCLSEGRKRQVKYDPVLLHFDCARPDHWHDKIRKRLQNMALHPAMEEVRIRQFLAFRDLLEKYGPQGHRVLFDEIHALPEDVLKKLVTYGIVERIDVPR